MRVHAVVLALTLVPVTAGAAELVAPQTLKASYFDGKAITSTDGHGRKSIFTFSADGKVTRKTTRGLASEGTWTLSADGFCMKLGKAKRDSCYIAVKGSDGGIRVMPTGKNSFAWTR